MQMMLNRLDKKITVSKNKDSLFDRKMERWGETLEQEKECRIIECLQKDGQMRKCR